MVSKPFVCENDKTAGDNEVEESPWNFGYPMATLNWGQPLTTEILWSALSIYEQGSALFN